MKTIRSMFLSLMLVAVATHSQSSKAATGLIAAAPAVVTGGLYIAGAGAGTYGLGAILQGGNWDAKFTGGLLQVFIAIPLLFVGLIVLDGEQGIQFAELSNKEAVNLKISQSELAAYNLEIDQINNLAAFVDEEVSSDANATPEKAALIWTEYKDALSSEAFNALVKVNAQMYNSK